MSSVVSDSQLSPSITIQKGIEDVETAINLFLNDKFEEARNVCKTSPSLSCYHALGDSTLGFFEAVFIFDKEAFSTAAKVIENSLLVCESIQKHYSFKEYVVSKFNKSSTYVTFSETEVHAELCYCEMLLIKGAVAFMEDETITSFVKGGLNMRNSFNGYKRCNDILNVEQWKEWNTKMHFESGVKFGLGAFNLLISMLPGRTLKLLEFIGFSGDKEVGLTYLEECCNMTGLRRPFAIILFLAYHLLMKFLLTFFKADIVKCQNILDVFFEIYPKGIVYRYLKARLNFVNGNLDQAISGYQKMCSLLCAWPQIYTFGYWDLMQLYSLKRDWDNAFLYSDKLIQTNKWSKCVYTYLKAAILIMKPDNYKYRNEVDDLMKAIPEFKQQISGKSMPSEKFVIGKSQRYFEQNRMLFLPIYEFAYVSNLLQLLSNNKSTAENILEEIENSLRQLDVPDPLTEYDNDNKALLLMLKGCCLRHLASYDLAISILDQTISMEKDIIHDKYIVPYSKAEKGLALYANGNKAESIKILEDAKKNYSGFLLENRLSFRIQSALSEFSK